MLVIPGLHLSNLDAPRQLSIKAHFAARTLKFAETLRQKSDALIEPLPAWVSRFLLPGESKFQSDLIAANKTLGDIQRAIADIETQLTELMNLKATIAGTGSSVEKAILNIFTGLGVSVAPGPKGEADIILEHAGRLAVIEAKGVASPPHSNIVGNYSSG